MGSVNVSMSLLDNISVEHTIIEAMSRPIFYPKEVFEPETVVDTTAVTATGTTLITTSPTTKQF